MVDVFKIELDYLSISDLVSKVVFSGNLIATGL